MPSEPISALTNGNPAQAGDLIPIARAGANFSVTAASLAAASGSSPVGANVFLIPPMNDQNTGINGYTLVLKMPAGMLAATGNGGVIVKLMTGNAGPFLVNAAAIGATLANYIEPGAISGFVPNYAWTTSPVALIWPGGSFASTTTAYASNPCAIDIDSEHDYYVMIYIDPSAEGSVPLFFSSGEATWDFIGGIILGNHTADADASALNSGSMNFDGINGVVSVNLA